MANNLDYKNITFPVSKKDYKKIEQNTNISINVFYHENNLVHPAHITKLMDNENKAYWICIKNFNRFVFNKTKHKAKKHFCRYCFQYFSSDRFLNKHKEICLKINGKQSAKLESGTIKFKNCFKQIAIPFKIYAVFESFLKKCK